MHIFFSFGQTKRDLEGEEETLMIMDRIALILAIIGGINWGSIGLFRFDLVAWLSAGRPQR